MTVKIQNPEFKMAAQSSEIFILIRHVYNICCCKFPTATSIFSVYYPNKILLIINNANENTNFEMAAQKPEKLLTRQILKKLQIFDGYY